MKVKEGWAAVEKIGGLPVISSIRRSQEKDDEEEETDVLPNQVVMMITVRTWKVFGKTFVCFSRI